MLCFVSTRALVVQARTRRASKVICGTPHEPLDLRSRMFEPFVTTKEHGSGLGLSIVHRAIESHHGFVLVDSTDAGTTFTIVLPRLKGGELAVNTSTADDQQYSRVAVDAAGNFVKPVVTFFSIPFIIGTMSSTRAPHRPGK